MTEEYLKVVDDEGLQETGFVILRLDVHSANTRLSSGSTSPKRHP
eukprot:COSAG02_NODE_2038_length_10038_cov_3.193480_5_plen_45_part_00